MNTYNTRHTHIYMHARTTSRYLSSI